MEIHIIKQRENDCFSNQKGNKLLHDHNDAYLPLDFMM